MSIVGLVIWLALLSLGAWFGYTWVKPKSAFIGNIIIAAMCIIALIVVLNAFGLIGEVRNAQVPHL